MSLVMLLAIGGADACELFPCQFHLRCLHSEVLTLHMSETRRKRRRKSDENDGEKYRSSVQRKKLKSLAGQVDEGKAPGLDDITPELLSQCASG